MSSISPDVAQEYQRPEFRYGHRFGHGTYASFNANEPIIEEVRKLAWSHGCPVPEALLAQRDPRELALRYADLNLQHRLTVITMKRPSRLTPDPDYGTFVYNTRRLTKPGTHEPTAVPVSYLDYMAPLVSLPGSTISRMLVETRGRNNHSYDALHKADSLLARVLHFAPLRNPMELVALIASSSVTNARLEPVKVLQMVYSAAYLSEQRTVTNYQDLVKQLDKRAPDVWKAYCDLNSDQRAQLGIAEIPTL